MKDAEKDSKREKRLFVKICYSQARHFGAIYEVLAKSYGDDTKYDFVKYVSDYVSDRKQRREYRKEICPDFYDLALDEMDPEDENVYDYYGYNDGRPTYDDYSDDVEGFSEMI